jgi:CheY-like chemotaxis protein
MVRRPVTKTTATASATRILIVDPDRQVGVSLSFMLSARQYDDVRAVRSVKRALAITEQFRPEIIFLDLEMPEGGGITVARQLTRGVSNPRPRLIALTMSAEHPMGQEARSAGFERLVVKPVSHEELDKILGISRAA